MPPCSRGGLELLNFHIHAWAWNPGGCSRARARVGFSQCCFARLTEFMAERLVVQASYRRKDNWLGFRESPSDAWPLSVYIAPFHPIVFTCFQDSRHTTDRQTDRQTDTHTHRHTHTHTHTHIHPRTHVRTHAHARTHAHTHTHTHTPVSYTHLTLPTRR